jgi:hypothetical protein
MKNLNIKNQFIIGYKLLNDEHYIEINKKSFEEKSKTTSRTEIINFLLKFLSIDRETKYLEIGVRNPNHNFNKILSPVKYSVDPGIEFESNPVDFKMTSDDFFESITEGKILNENVKFDVIFIDGLHLADQVDKDIKNSLKFINDDGFIVLHDCNPPSEFHARENYEFKYTPAKGYWNGTTWKAFFKYRKSNKCFSCCIDSDWGVGIISKTKDIGKSTTIENNFYDYYVLNDNRKESLNLINFDELKKKLTK